MNNLKRIILRQISKRARPYLKSFGFLQTVKLFNKSAIVWQPEGKRILVLSPHMDDEVIGCGGTIYKHVCNKAEVTVVYMTDGRAGSSQLLNLSLNERKKEELKLIDRRKDEANKALVELGVSASYFLDAEETNLKSTEELQKKIKQIITTVNPEIVYLPFSWKKTRTIK